jgi:uncharacterized membrane protein
VAYTNAVDKKVTVHSGMENVVGYILLGGVSLSVALIVGATGRFQFEYLIGKMNLARFVSSDLQQLIAGPVRPRYLINLGIATLILTPYMRILASVLYFALVARNWKYALFTAAVFSALTYSLFGR